MRKGRQVRWEAAVSRSDARWREQEPGRGRTHKINQKLGALLRQEECKVGTRTSLGGV